MNLIYTYCITKNPSRRFSLKGINNQHVFPITCQGLTAIVSQVKHEEFNKKSLLENLKKPKWAERAIRTHARVTQQVVKKDTVLPLKFGTIFKNEKGVKKMLRENKAKFLSLLTKLKDKEEWGVKIYGDRDKLAKILGEKEREIKNLKKEIITASTGRAYLLEKKLMEKLEEKVGQTLNQCASEIFKSLAKVSEASQLTKNLPSSLSGKEKEMILNSVFLVNKKESENFSRSLNRLLKKYQRFAIEGELSGPWPAYNFL